MNFESVVKEIPIKSAVVLDVTEETPKVSVSDAASKLAELSYALACESQGALRWAEKHGVDESDVIEYYTWLFNVRLGQVASVKGKVAYRDVPVPHCVYPLLEAIGSYESVDDGLIIKPQPDAEVTKKALQAYHRPEVVTFLKLGGITFNTGMPIATGIDKDFFYRLAVRDGEIIAAESGGQIDPFTVLARIFYDFEALSRSYGEYRYSYGSVRLFSSAMDALARLGI